MIDTLSHGHVIKLFFYFDLFDHVACQLLYLSLVFGLFHVCQYLWAAAPTLRLLWIEEPLLSGGPLQHLVALP